jgi:hypothetical protein
VGDGVGGRVGVGLTVGVGVLVGVGLTVGVGVRTGVGPGVAVGAGVGAIVGTGVGAPVGCGVGTGAVVVGTGVGWTVGSVGVGVSVAGGSVGARLGVTVAVGEADGWTPGLVPGCALVACGTVGEGAAPGDCPTAVLPLGWAGWTMGDVGIPNVPTAKATVARARFRIPRATTRRARWTDVTAICASRIVRHDPPSGVHAGGRMVTPGLSGSTETRYVWCGLAPPVSAFERRHVHALIARRAATGDAFEEDEPIGFEAGPKPIRALGQEAHRRGSVQAPVAPTERQVTPEGP